MTQETLARLIRQYIDNDGPDVPLYVSSLVEQERVLRAKIADVKRRIRDEDKQHYEASFKLLHELGDIRLECPHWETNYQGDPSGGSDRSETCELCGKELQ